MNNQESNAPAYGGIVFLRTLQPELIKDFYVHRIGCDIWLEQSGCFILQHGNMLLGFCHREETDTSGIYTFFYTSRDGVDRMYENMKDIADGPPRDNPQYHIYHFYGTDPEGRTIEFQYFNHTIPHF